MFNLPPHLRKFVVNQNYSKYTPIDQAVWRFILRQLKNFLSDSAHESYLEGLEKTGIEIEQIPSIDNISNKLEKFGWRALPVSGFIPPAAFMELQSLGVLPIASDLRTLEHLLYTPAPDIVHEAAGHAPILADPEFAQYLRDYAQVAKKAIISSEDMALYDAIRSLSDLKESPETTAEQVQKAQAELDRISKSMSHVSEASELSRMNWWTAEYGLIGSLENPRIYGAGLLSSVGEAKWCLSDKVKKLPLTIDCIKQSYDITEPQPQLFVTPDFKTLSKVLEELANQMAFRTGGRPGLQKALESKLVNTSQWSSGLQVSGQLDEVLFDQDNEPSYLRFSGPTQLSFQDQELPGHDKTYHSHGFGSPVGKLQDGKRISELKTESRQKIHLTFSSGVTVEGVFEKSLKLNSQTLLWTLGQCTVKLKDRVLFDPAWGKYDMAIGETISSVFGGPADRAAYGETENFVPPRVPERKYSKSELIRQKQYFEVRLLREKNLGGEKLWKALRTLMQTHDQQFPQDWLFRIEVLEILKNHPGSDLEGPLREKLDEIKNQLPDSARVINDGLTLASQP